jgi:putative glutathione S-transferase
MGVLVDGVWHDQTRDPPPPQGHFVRSQSAFRNWVTPDGSPGPTGKGGFRAEGGRYHLYVSLACPWAHRTLIYRKLKGLEHMIDVSVTHWLMGADGWTFAPGQGVIPDEVNGVFRLHELYTLADPHYSGRVSVPVLWDKRTRTIVSNESSEIIRMLNSAFDDLGAVKADYYPLNIRAEIDALNTRIYETLNNGVYRCGFATTQQAYEEAVYKLFDTLDMLDSRLQARRFLCGSTPTEADWRLFPTLVRFDSVYHGHFKCNIRRITDYRNLWGYTRDLYQWPGIVETINFDHIKRHYYMSHRNINPAGIVPAGPYLDWEAPPTRVPGFELTQDSGSD